MTDLYVIAGEPSADKLGAPIVRELLKKAPKLQVAGIGGPCLRELGIRGSSRMEELQVMGFSAVAAALPRLVRIFYRTRNEILRLNPKAVLCIDYPGFNLRLESSLRFKGYRGKLIHAVAPTVWAWGKKRIPKMAKTLDLLLTLFPFEKECFANTSLPVSTIGHPLVSLIAAHIPFPHFHTHYGLDPQKPILAIFPGSRRSAIEKNLPLQLAAAQELQSRIPNQSIVLSLSHPERRSLIRSFAPDLPLIEPTHTYDLMRSARLALATSGTVTLELALFAVPTVVSYAIRPIDGFLAQKLFRINRPHYCIVNILAKREVFPEKIGPNLSAHALQLAAEALWERPEPCIEGCKEVRSLLGELDAAPAAAEQIFACLESSS